MLFCVDETEAIMKTISFTLIFLFIFHHTYSQSRTVYVLIKEQKAKSWSCPDQQIAFKILPLSSRLDYHKKQKVLNVFKKRFKANEDDVRIKEYSVTMKQNDYLVFYEYKYRYLEKEVSKCKTNIRRIIKGFPISIIEKIPEKLEAKLKQSLHKDRYVSHKVLEIKQPFVSKEASYLDKFLNYIRKKYPNGKPKKSTGIGIRG